VTEAATAETTLDAFHRGGFWLVQPAGRGHRAGSDAMILGAAVPDGFSGMVADLGAGAGAAGLAVLSRCPGARAVLVERSSEMARCARSSLALEGNAALAARASVIELDLTVPGRQRAAAGLGDAGVDFAIMNPPFNEARDRATPDALRREAHVMEEDGLARWVRVAAAIVRPRGGFAAIVRPGQMAPLLAAMAGRFGGAEVKGIHPRPTAPAIRVVVRGWKGSRADTALMPPLLLHDAAGNRFTAEADAVTNGRAGLFPA
jgi:tRNA1(Val) A37 N6-methylase TrmN6